MIEDIGGEEERKLREADKQLDSISIGTEAKEILAANPDRKAYLIQNNGPQDLYVGFSSSVTPSRYSAKLLAGAIIEDNKYKGAWWGVTETGANDVRFMEIT